jgi:hypothetical protein
MLREQSVDVGLRPRGDALEQAESRLGREVWLPKRVPGDLKLQFVDSVLSDSSGLLPYSLLGYAEHGDDGAQTLTISQFANFVDFPHDKAIPIPTGTDGVEMWSPPSPFSSPDGRLNYQYIVRTGEVQLLFWFVGPAEPDLDDVRRLVAATIP